MFTVLALCVYVCQCGVIGHRMTPHWPPNHPKLVPGNRVFTIIGPCVYDSRTACLQCHLDNTALIVLGLLNLTMGTLGPGYGYLKVHLPLNHPKFVPWDRVFTILGACVYSARTVCLRGPMWGVSWANLG